MNTERERQLEQQIARLERILIHRWPTFNDRDLEDLSYALTRCELLITDTPARRQRLEAFKGEINGELERRRARCRC
jgi:hypothetical protein